MIAPIIDVAMISTSNIRIQGAIATLLLLSLLVCTAARAADQQALVSGTVRDEGGHPLPKIRVCLRDDASSAARCSKTDKQGRFVLVNDFQGACSLAVTPGIKSGLSRAMIERVPGHETRQFVVQLRHGFNISGRIVYEGRGVKGMIVKVVPADAGTENDSSVHGGALTTTAGDGSFRVVLTPGEKYLVVINEKYSGLVPQLKQKVDITGDTRVPDIPLPLLAKP